MDGAEVTDGSDYVPIGTVELARSADGKYGVFISTPNGAIGYAYGISRLEVAIAMAVERLTGAEE